MATTYKGRKVYICATPQASTLDQAGYEALTWIEIKNVGSVGEAGVNAPVSSYLELATDVVQKSKGVINAGDPVLEMARNPTDAGQIALRAAAATEFIYAFKFDDDDAPAANYTNTVIYNRGVVSGPVRPSGNGDAYIVERFTLGLVQKEVVVDPTALVAPTNTVKPAVSGGATTQGTVLTALEGTWTGNPAFTYQWQRDAAGNGSFTNISSATSRTYTLAAGDASDCVRVQVTGTNGAGNATANSLPTKAVT